VANLPVFAQSKPHGLAPSLAPISLPGATDNGY
jgi:hypothetical protein